MRTRFTRQDLEQLPEDQRAELVEGHLVMVPAPDPFHQRVAGDLHGALWEHVGRDRILFAPTDVVLDEETVLQPDLLVLPEGTRATKRPWRIPAPIWIAEVLSPKTAERDRGVKLRLYARLGVKEAWLVDPDTETIEVRDLTTGTAALFRAGERATSRVLPGFAVDVAGLFEV